MFEQQPPRYSQVQVGEPVDDFQARQSQVPRYSDFQLKAQAARDKNDDRKQKCCIVTIILLVIVFIVTIILLASTPAKQPDDPYDPPTPDPPAPITGKTCILVEKSRSQPGKGYKLMSSKDVLQTTDMCKNEMSNYEIVALQDAKYDGPGYGSKFSYGNYLGCGYVGKMLLMEGTQTESLNFDAPCP